METNIVELNHNIYLLKGFDNSSHSYVIKGDYRNILIDSGLDSSFPVLQEQLLKIGLKIRDVDIILNTHEHFDHIGANRYFQNHSLIAAHRFAATKMKFNDKYVTLYKSGDSNEISLHVHLWMENKTRLDLGNFVLDIIHTPGHTSGSVCIYEPSLKCLFTGDTLFAGGVLSYIAESGSVGDYINSIMTLNTLNIKEIYPGHGNMSSNPGEDLKNAVHNAMCFLNKDEKTNITYTLTNEKNNS
ncbi:MAG: MBL fold metallo-hydrolase [Spirochaetes bacterium]|nr:MBL fold metallo-hydrolase [Spirochaetota bacterium]